MTYKAKPGASKIMKAVRLCERAGCRRYTMYKLCAEHRVPEPAGEWLVAKQLRDELAGLDEEEQEP